jgi:hypothetical protein
MQVSGMEETRLWPLSRRKIAHPGLRNEKLSGTEQWAFNITMSYRAAYILRKRAFYYAGGKTEMDRNYTLSL